MKRNYKLLFLITGIISLAPLLFFILKFNQLSFSNNPIDWTNFASYFNGTVGTIVSLVSFVMLAIISIDIHNLSNEEHEKSLLKERKREAYDKLSEYLPIINSVPANLVRSFNSINTEFVKQRIENGDDSFVLDQMREIASQAVSYSEYHNFLYIYNVRYSHLFELDFDHTNYNKVVSTSADYKKVLDKLYDSILNMRDLDPKGLTDQAVKHVDELEIFLNTLRDEITN